MGAEHLKQYQDEQRGFAIADTYEGPVLEVESTHGRLFLPNDGSVGPVLAGLTSDAWWEGMVPFLMAHKHETTEVVTYVHGVLLLPDDGGSNLAEWQPQMRRGTECLEGRVVQWSHVWRSLQERA